MNWKARIEKLEEKNFVDGVFKNLRYGEFGFWLNDTAKFRCFRFTALSEPVQNWIQETESSISN